MSFSFFELIRFKDISPQPWKNGQGETREIVRSPASGDFDWRLSVATIAGDDQGISPFSQYAGYDRLLMPVSGGDGLTLKQIDEDSASTKIHRLSLFQPLVFKGEDNVSAIEVASMSSDFNVMVRRLWGRFEFQIFTNSHVCSLDSPKTFYSVSVLSGSCELKFSDHVYKDLNLQPVDTLVCKPESASSMRLGVTSCSRDFVGVLIGFSPF